MDKEYWQNYYKRNLAPTQPSSFAKFVLGSYVVGGQKLIEMGCGNGRDARFFAESGVNVTAVDQAVQHEAVISDNLEFRQGDFTNLEQSESEYDTVYSRFTLHSVNNEGQGRTIEWAKRALKIGGFLCVEVRGQMNSLYRQGVPVDGEDDAYINDGHYRRFVDKASLDRQTRAAGLYIVSSVEDTGFAPFNNEDDYFIRHISRRLG